VLFGGLEKMPDLPKALLVLGATSHETAVREANRLSIPIVAIMANDADPDRIQYPIPANDRSRTSIAWVMERLTEAMEAGKKEALTPATK